MRIESIIRELNSRVVEYEKVADQSYYATQHDTNSAAARALRGAVTLIESYRTEDD